jgi:hypothetical protein
VGVVGLGTRRLKLALVRSMTVFLSIANGNEGISALLLVNLLLVLDGERSQPGDMRFLEESLAFADREI